MSQSIAMVATLGVADHIKQGPRAAVELAARVGADAGALSRLLRLLADVGVFTELEGRSFALASLGELPCSGHEASMREHAMLQEAPFVRKAWTDLLGAARTGNPARARPGEVAVRLSLRAAEDDAVFDAANGGHLPPADRRDPRCLRLSLFGTVVDVDGSNGELLAGSHPG